MRDRLTDRMPDQPQRGVILGVHTALTFALIALAATDWVRGIPPAAAASTASWTVTLLFPWCLWSWFRSQPNRFEPYTLFLVSAFLFNGGLAFLYCFQSDGIMPPGASEPVFSRALFLVAACLAAAHCGALLTTRNPGEEAAVAAPAEDEARDAATRTVGWVLLLLAAYPAASNLIQALRLVVSGGYFSLYQAEVVTGAAGTLSIIAEFLVPGAFFILAVSQKNRWTQYGVASVLAVTTAANLFMGSRGRAIVVVASAAWIWHRRVRPINGTAFAAAALVLVLLIPVIGQMRNDPGAERTSLGAVREASSGVDNPLVATLAEMGGSLRVTTDCLQLVPDSRPYDLGASYYWALFSFVPNLGWELHPSAANALYKWFVWTVDPAFAAIGGGLGFSFIAEAYVNFGFWGAPLVTCLIGYGVGRMSRWTEHAQPAALAAAAVSLSYLLFYARSETTDAFRGIVWYSMFPYLAVDLMPRFRFHSAAAAAAR